MSSEALFLHEWLTRLREHSKVFTGTLEAIPSPKLGTMDIKCLVQVDMAPQISQMNQLELLNTSSFHFTPPH